MRDSTARAREIATRFPRSRTRLGTAGAAHGAAPEGSSGFGLLAILDGLQARLSSLRET